MLRPYRRGYRCINRKTALSCFSLLREGSESPRAGLHTEATISTPIPSSFPPIVLLFPTIPSSLSRLISGIPLLLMSSLQCTIPNSSPDFRELCPIGFCFSAPGGGTHFVIHGRITNFKLFNVNRCLWSLRIALSLEMVLSTSLDVIGANLKPAISFGMSPLGVQVELVPRRMRASS